MTTGTAGPDGAAGARAVVIGIGNEFRRDDGVGPAVLRRLRGRVPDWVRLAGSDGEPVRLIEAWSGIELAIVVDAVRAEAAPDGRAGRVHRLVIDQADEAGLARAVSSHGLGLGEAVGLARSLGLMPGRLIVHAIEASEFNFGTEMSAPVAAVVDEVASAVLGDLAVGLLAG